MSTWVLFDLNGTLLDPASIGRPLGDEELGDQALDLAIVQAMADTLCGEFRPLPEYLEAALRRLTQAAERVEDALGAAKAMEPFPDAGPALAILRDAGLRTGVLTNSAADAARHALEAAALDGAIELIAGADEVGAYKPDARVYRHGLERTGAAAADVWLVAAHWWDVLGAKRAGLRTGWVSRREGKLLSTVPAPDVTGGTLVAVAEAISSPP